MNEQVLSAGVVVVRRADEGWRVLLLRVYNYWDFPKGLVEPGEDPLTTARRETRAGSGVILAKRFDLAHLGAGIARRRELMGRVTPAGVSVRTNGPISGDSALR